MNIGIMISGKGSNMLNIVKACENGTLNATVKIVISNTPSEGIAKAKKIGIPPKIIEPKLIIPKHNVERLDRLSGAFEQGKVYVTIDKNTSNEDQKLLCQNLTSRYSEFSNIVICLYSNDRAGKELARGNDSAVSIEEQKQSWLAMYTYNSVEGEYFDDNPSSYLGIY